MPDLPKQLPGLGDFFVTATRGPLLDRAAAEIIDWVTATRDGHGNWLKAKVNHAGLFVGPTRQYPEGAIVEAVRRVRYSSILSYPNAIWSTNRLPPQLTPTPLQRRTIVAYAESRVGDKYNVLDLVAVGLAQDRLGHHVDGDEWWVKRLSDDHREICSQVVDAAWHAAGIQLFRDGRLEGLVTPNDLNGLLLPAAA